MEATAFDDAEQTLQLLDIGLSIVGKLREAQWWRMQPAEMLALGQKMQGVSNELYTAQVNLAAELDSEKIGQKFGCTSTAALLRQAFNISPAEANSRVNAARKVAPRESESAGVLPALLPGLAAAMAAGQVNSEHVKLIVTTMSKLPPKLPVQDVDFWEQFLVDKAAILDPSPFEKVCRSILDKADPDGSLDESTAAAKMEFSFGNRNLRTGLTPVKGQLDDYSVEVIKQAIDALSAPRPCANTKTHSAPTASTDTGSGEDDRPDVDAVAETHGEVAAGTKSNSCADADADHGADTPGSTMGAADAGDLTAADMTDADANRETSADADADADADAETETETNADADADAETETETDADANRETSASADANRETSADAETDAITSAAGGAVSSEAAAGAWTECGADSRDSRPPANRRAHALVAALRGFLDAGVGPTQGGERPHITMVMNWDIVKGVVTEAGYSSGGAISPAQARKFLCDAQIIPAIMGGKSEVLDVGRKSRTFPAGMRRAIALRDGGCIWPGCDRPPGWCDCHHVEFWHRDHGDTCYRFGVLLCPHHHTEIHKEEWVINMSTDGIPELIPPKWLDPDQKPRRNNMHRPLEA